MGNSSCSDLIQYSNACEMHHCTHSVIGLPSNSASPTDVWILNLKPGTHYDEEPIDTAFLKWWVSPTTAPASWGDSTMLSSLLALDYEERIYKDIIRPILDHNICPNFVKYLASGNRCTFADMETILADKAHVNNDPQELTLTTSDVTKNLLRSLTYMTKDMSGRKAITAIGDVIEIENEGEPNEKRKKIASIAKQNISKWRYNLLVNESTKPGTQDFEKWLESGVPGWSNKTSTQMPTTVWKILFQVCVGFYVMSLAKTTHNDCHHGNVWVEPIDGGLVDYTYVINGNKYVVETDKKAMIYDFDRSYAVMLGPNPYLSESTLCDDANQCNEYISNKDMVKFLSYLYKESQNETDKDMILDVICPDDAQKAKMKAMYNYRLSDTLFSDFKKGTFMFYPDINDDPVRMKPEDFALLRPMEGHLSMIDRIATYAGLKKEPDNWTPQHLATTFVCDNDMFDKYGRIKTTSSSVLYYQQNEMNAKQTKIDELISELQELKNSLGDTPLPVKRNMITRNTTRNMTSKKP
jgi:hypothetical protein